jgi:hypothetical protein
MAKYRILTRKSTSSEVLAIHVNANSISSAMAKIKRNLNSDETVISTNMKVGQQWEIIEGEEVDESTIEHHPDFNLPTEIKGNTNLGQIQTRKARVSLEGRPPAPEDLKKEKLYKNSLKSITYDEYESYPTLSLFFFLLAFLSLIGGLILCGLFWPGDAGIGMQWKMSAYIPALTSFMFGVVQFGIFTAVGQGLAYLRKISINTSH